MNLEVLISGGDDAGDRVDSIGARALHPQPAFRDILDKLMGAQRRLFATGRGWPPDRPSTQRRKARDGLDPRPLHGTGRLERFLTTQSAASQPLTLDRNELVIGIPGGRHDVHYGRYQRKYGRDPLIGPDVVRRAARPILLDFLLRRP